ncbi:hypothetical protein E4U14_007506 [Claviceps sp. LM454 group G7]|nr:hypothetical protein E4U14_007506 [Claviceps sp. LM454 group G7]
MGPEFRPEWARPEKSRPGDVSHLVDVAIQNWKDTLAGDETRCSKLSSASFRDNLASWLAEQFGAGEKSSPSGPTTGEANADAESIKGTSAVSTHRDAGGEENHNDCDPVRASDSAMTQPEPLSSPSGPMPTADIDAGGEDDHFDLGIEDDFSMTEPEPLSSPSGQMPTADTDAGGEDEHFDLGTERDFAVAKAKNKSALSIPSTAKKNTALSVPTQQATPANKQKQACQTKLTAAQGISEKPLPSWSYGIKAVQKK